MPPSPDTGVECFAHVFDCACRGASMCSRPYAVSVLLFRGTGWLLWQGAPAGRALVVVRLRLASGWPVSDDFVGFRAREIWRHGPRALGWRRVGAGRLCLTETAGGYRRITVASAIRAIEAEAEQHNHFG